MIKAPLGLGFLALCFAATPLVFADPACSSLGGFQLLNQTVFNGQVFTVNGTNAFGTGLNGCTIGGIDFSNWEIAPNAGYPGPSGATLNVTVGTDPSGNLKISTNMNVSSGQDVEIEFSATPGELEDILSVGGGGGVNETVCSAQMDVTIGSCAGVSGTTLGLGSVGGSTSSANIFLTSSGTDWVFKDISGASEVSQDFTSSSVPEPMTLSIVGVGLLGLGLLGRRLRK